MTIEAYNDREEYRYRGREYIRRGVGKLLTTERTKEEVKGYNVLCFTINNSFLSMCLLFYLYGGRGWDALTLSFLKSVKEKE